MKWCNDVVTRKHPQEIRENLVSCSYFQENDDLNNPHQEGWLITILTLTDYPPTFPWHPTALEIHLPSSGPVKWGVHVDVSVSHIFCFLFPEPLGSKSHFFVLLQKSQNSWGFQTTSHFLSYAVPGAFSFSWQVDLDGTEPTLVGYLGRRFGSGERVVKILFILLQPQFVGYITCVYIYIYIIFTWFYLYHIV